MNENETKGPEQDDSSWMNKFRQLLGLKRANQGETKPVEVAEPGINDFSIKNFEVKGGNQMRVSFSSLSTENQSIYKLFVAKAKKLGMRGSALVNVKTGQLQFVGPHVIAQITSEQTHGGQDEKIQQLAKTYALFVD